MGAYQLKNEELTLTVISAGAEMKSLKDNKTEQEYLWQADPKFWGRTSPVLFPIVGNYVQLQVCHNEGLRHPSGNLRQHDRLRSSDRRCGFHLKSLIRKKLLASYSSIVNC